MKEHFQKQLEESKPITEDKLKELKGECVYDDYRVGDIILYFIERADKPTVPPSSINLTLRIVALRNLDKLDKDFMLIEERDTFPVLERRKQQMKLEPDDVSMPSVIKADIPDHVVMLSFNDDDQAYAFHDWWNTEGFKAFQKFFETWEE